MSRRPRSVLGIDAAWTLSQPTGVALAVEDRGRWTCAAVAPSYAGFARVAAGGAVDWGGPSFPGEEADAAALLAAAAALAPGAEVSVVAVDMPLARGPILGRRPCDDAVARAFGGRGCGTHSPSERRPGAIGSRLQRSFEARGFSLATAEARPARSLLEVFPHTALLSLLPSPYRVTYKASRAGRYWPDTPPSGRRARLLEEWRRILAALGTRIARIDLPLPSAPPRAGHMKRFEDALDALVCAWVGIEFLAGRASPYGDRFAAIWTPD